MEIQSARYVVENNTKVEITFDDASTFTQTYPTPRGQHTDQLNDWLEGKTQVWVADEAAYNQYLLDYAAWEEAGSIPEDTPTPIDPPSPPESELVPNTISEYDEFHGVSDETLRENNYEANRLYANSVIYSAEHTPNMGTTLDDKGTEKENKRRVNRAKGKAKISDADDTLADYVDSCYDALDNADDVVETLTRQQLIDWTADTWAYPVWTPIAP